MEANLYTILINPIVINSLGLFLDIIGVILLFIYGLPSKFHTPSTLLMEGDIDNKQKIENKMIKNRANLGLICLIIGFILQLISNFL